MPSFDVVCELDRHEVKNAVEQANREVTTRFDFKGSDATYELADKAIVLRAQTPFQLQQMIDILTNKWVKRSLDTAHLLPADPVVHHQKSEQQVALLEGIESQVAKKLIQSIKSAKFAVQASIQGDQVRVTSKKRDVLQKVIAHLKEGSFEAPLQFQNFRD